MTTQFREIVVKILTIPHPDAGLRLFASSTIEKGNVVCYRHGSLVYPNLTKARQTMETSGEGMMQVTSKTFRERANELLEKVTDNEGDQHKMWVEPVSFCVMLYISDARNLREDTMRETEKLIEAR